jgi:hypothetical protein
VKQAKVVTEQPIIFPKKHHLAVLLVRHLHESTNRQHNDQKEKVQKDKQRSTNHTYKTKDRVTRTPLKTGVNSGAPVW